jgi:hypothetical protein
MKTLGMDRFALSLSVAAVLFAGCGGSQPPIVAHGVTALSSAVSTQSDRLRSWISPEAANRDLMYVGGNSPAYLSMFTLPNGKLIGVIHNAGFSFLGGECVDARGDVFVTSGPKGKANGKIFEYKHGSTKLLETLDAPDREEPLDCTIDPKSGNLAVTSLAGADGAGGSVAIYTNAQGSPKIYRDPHIHSYYFCGYDNEGNLFIDGRNNLGHFRLVELPSRSSTFVDISLNQRMRLPSSVLWDGKYLVVGDQGVPGDQAPPNVYEFSISGSAGTLVNTTPINGVTNDRAFWIQGDRILVADNPSSRRSVELYAYPTGGNATKIITNDITHPNGLTVSLAPR